MDSTQIQNHFLVVGLGNPGARYEKTRHNIGFLIIDRVVTQYGGHFEEYDQVSISELRVSDAIPVIAAKPLVYMNNSGKAVRYLVDKFEIALSNLLVVFDDFNLPFGRLRLRRKGSSGGHKGIQSIIQSLDTDDFPRLRVGIGTEMEFEPIDFVLSEFDAFEQRSLPDIIELASHVCVEFVGQGLAKTMNKYN